MSELSWILENINGMGGIAAASMFSVLWWMEQRKVKDLASLLSANTTAITVLSVTVNLLFQAALSKDGKRK